VKADALRQARESKKISLQQIASMTRISPWILQRLDAGDFGALPAGIYARAYVRAYAAAVGLDPDATVREFEAALPRPEPGAGGAAADSVPQMTARARALVEVIEKTPGPSAAIVMHPTMAARARAVPRPAPRVTRWKLYAAAVVDTVLLAIINFILLALSAQVCGLSVFQMFDQAPMAMFMLFGMATASYFVLLGGIAGRTLGAYVMGIRLLELPKGPVDLRTIVRRGMRCLATETSILVGVLIPDKPSLQSARPRGSEPSPPARLQVLPKRLHAGH
jgi:uncharacterized RDD family membrane protein YckC